MTRKSQLPLIVIVGPTASGKTGLAIRLAREFGGEIISADSRAVYSGLDIGTAKPTKEEQQLAPHWGIDIALPSERFTAADFKHYAVQKIAEIRSRGHIPLLVGGTGLYVDSVVYDYEFPDTNQELSERNSLDAMNLDELYDYCMKNNINLPENYKNKRYVINTILRKGQALRRRTQPIENCFIVGIATDKTTLRTRIENRAEDIFSQKVIDEAEGAARTHGWDNEAMTGNIYPLLRRHMAGELSIDDAKRAFITLDWHLAKRQMTWLKRSEHIRWLPLDDAYTYCARVLANLNNS